MKCRFLYYDVVGIVLTEMFQQIREEFHRITNKNLTDDFRSAINQHTPRLLRLYRARRTVFPPEMDQLLNRLGEEVNLRHNDLFILDFMDKCITRNSVIFFLFLCVLDI